MTAASPVLQSRARVRLLRTGPLVAVLAAAVACDVGSPDHVADWRATRDSSTVLVVEESREACRDCMRLTPGPILGQEPGEGYLEVSLQAIRDDLGRFWVLQRDGAKVFDGDGRFLRTVGTSGEGPGEFSMPTVMFTAEDGSVHILDAGNVRGTVYDAEFGMVREYRLPGSVLTAVPMDGGYAATMHGPRRDGGALPLHLVEGESVRAAFGTPEFPGSAAVYRRLATDSAGWVYSARLYDYEVTAWRPSAEKGFMLRRPELFAPRPRTPPAQRPEPRPVFGEVRAMRVDSMDHLWVIVSLARGGPDGPPVRSLEDFRTVIDVIDLSDGESVARHDIDVPLLGFLDEDWLFGVLYSPVGEPWIGTWRMDFEVTNR